MPLIDIDGNINDKDLDDNFNFLLGEVNSLKSTVSDLSLNKATKSEIVREIDLVASNIINDTVGVSGYAVSNALLGLKNRIDNIIASSGTSSTEVVDSRYDSVFDVTYSLLKLRLDAMSQYAKDLYDEVLTPLTTPITVQETIKSLTAGALDMKVNNLSWKGLTLVNSVENGDISTTLTSDDTGTIIDINTDGTWEFNGNYDATNQTFNISNGDEIFCYVKLTSSSIGQIRDLILKYSSSNSDSIFTNGSNEIYGTITATETNKANFKITEDSAGDITKESQMLINKTNLGLTTLTEPQMLDLVRSGYIDGIQSMYRPKLEIRNSDETNNSQITADVYIRGFNGVYDEIYESNNQIYESKKIKEDELESGDITQYYTALTNVDTINLSGFDWSNTQFNGDEDFINWLLIEGFNKKIVSNTNDVLNEWTFGADAVGVYLVVPKGTYANIGEAQADLAGTVIQYQLETPETINLTEQGLVDGQLESRENGTVYNTSDTFGSVDVSFDVPTNRAGQIASLIEANSYQQEQIDTKANKVQEEIIVPTLINSWTGTPYYYLNEVEEVELSGLLQSGTGIAFTLPTGYRPSVEKKFKQADATTGNPTVTIGTDGTVTPSGDCYLDGISFRVGE